MALFNHSTREVTAKLVYYGPGLSGKTTNLKWIHEHVPLKHKGQLVSLATEADRTLVFDFLPIELGVVRGFKTRMQVYTVPGQVFYENTRRIVLKGADAVVFVADSQEAVLDSNLESLKSLHDNLLANGLDPALPMVLQYNKRDAPTALPVAVLDEKLNPRRLPAFEAVAIEGKGVEDALKAITRLLFAHLSSLYAGPEEQAPAKTVPPPAETAPPPAPTTPAAPAAPGAMPVVAKPAAPPSTGAAPSPPATPERPAVAPAKPAVGTAPPPATPVVAKPATAQGSAPTPAAAPPAAPTAQSARPVVAKPAAPTAAGAAHPPVAAPARPAATATPPPPKPTPHPAPGGPPLPAARAAVPPPAAPAPPHESPAPDPTAAKPAEPPAAAAEPAAPRPEPGMAVEEELEALEALEIADDTDATTGASAPDGWFYLQARKRYGPIDIEDLIDLVLGSGPEDMLVWSPRLTEWTPANAVPQIAEELPPPLPRTAGGIAEALPDFATVPELLRTVLVADQNAAFRKFLGMPLLAQGFRLWEASDGAEAWRLAREKRPWLILADTALPEVDGFEFCRRVRAHSLISRTPLMFVSSSDNYKERYRGIQAGADDFLSKQTPIRELLLRIQVLLTRYSDLGPSARQAGVVAGAAAEAAGMVGDLEILGGPAVLQIVNQGRLTGTFSATEPGGGRAEFRFRDGDIIGATTDATTGPEAVYAFLAWTKGHFSFAPGDPGEGAPIARSVEHLLLEGCRLLDESRRDEASPELTEGS